MLNGSSNIPNGAMNGASNGTSNGTINGSSSVTDVQTNGTSNGTTNGIQNGCSSNGTNSIPSIPWDPDMDLWWHEVMDKESDQCEPVWVDAEDPLFILYTR